LFPHWKQSRSFPFHFVCSNGVRGLCDLLLMQVGGSLSLLLSSSASSYHHITTQYIFEATKKIFFHLLILFPNRRQSIGWDSFCVCLSIVSTWLITMHSGEADNRKRRSESEPVGDLSLT
jgi:hypothetical protein